MRLSRGSSTVTFLRLCSRAPRMRIVSVDTETPRASERRECSSDPGRTHVRSVRSASLFSHREGDPKESDVANHHQAEPQSRPRKHRFEGRKADCAGGTDRHIADQSGYPAGESDEWREPPEKLSGLQGKCEHCACQ